MHMHVNGISHMSGIFYSFHMYIHEQGKWSFHRQYPVRKDVVLMQTKNLNRLEHILKYICMRVHEEIEWSGKVQWDSSKIQQWWDQSGRHSDVCKKCGEKMDVVAKSSKIPLKSNSKWDQSGSWSFLSKCSDLWHVQFH